MANLLLRSEPDCVLLVLGDLQDTIFQSSCMTAVADQTLFFTYLVLAGS